MDPIVSSPMFGILLCIITFKAGLIINQKLKSPLANPLLIAITLIIMVLKIFHIPLDSFNRGGNIISMFLAPATAVLALAIYRQIDHLKKHFWPIIIGSLVGSVTSISSIFLLCKMFRLDETLIASLVPKSVTTPIAMEISRQGGGIIPVTVAAVILTGIAGAVLAPTLIKLFKVDHPVAAGVAIGTSSHAVGTSKAIEIGETTGAMSGIAIGAAGIITVILSLFL